MTISIANKIKDKKNKKEHSKWPLVSILIAAYNEDLVIEAKIKSILSSSYPIEKIEIIIGTDNCTDKTDDLIRKFADLHENIHHVQFNERSGKIKIINSIVDIATGELLILTDANVLFTENTIETLVNQFTDSKVGLVDSNMKSFGMKSTGISIPEKAYISLEGKLKNAEGKLWGSMMGPFGGCFAIRTSLFTKIPETYLVDDFFLNMTVLQQGSDCINEPDAIVYEDVSNDLKTEFNRKLRISAGNFQNLSHFAYTLLKFNRVAFVFLSHKILRWMSPFLLLASGIILCFLFGDSLLYLILFMSYIVSIGIVCIDLFLLNFGIHIKPFRFLTHFVAMNAALFIGFFKYLKGSENSIWKRTERLQK